MSWQADGMGSIEMPGRVRHLAAAGDQLWAACEVKRRWWQFWQPLVSVRWIKVPPIPEPPEATK